MNNERERDDAALIEQARKNLEARYAGQANGAAGRDSFALEVLRLAREGWKPEPDRTEVLAKKLWNVWNNKYSEMHDGDCFINEAFAALRAEIEAERPVIDLPSDVQEAAEWMDAEHFAKYPRTLARFVKQLTNGAGVRAKPVFSEEVLAAARHVMDITAKAGTSGLFSEWADVMARAILGEK